MDVGVVHGWMIAVQVTGSHVQLNYFLVDLALRDGIGLRIGHVVN